MHDLSLRARVYLAGVVALALAAAAASVSQPPVTSEQVLLCLLLSVLAGIGQLFEVRTPNNNAYVVTPLFLVSAALLLPLLPAAITAAVPFLVEQVRKPKSWYIQSFNIASHVLATLAAAVTAQAVDGSAGGLGSHLSSAPTAAAAGVAAAAVLLIVNHGTLVGVLYLARGVSPRTSGLFGLEGLLTDAALTSLGVVQALLWDRGPPLVLFVVVPIALLQRALHYPALQRASRTDAKTGLFNAAYFREASETQLARSARIDEPAAIIVADLDLLRDVNNTYGHLAGDQVLLGVADVLTSEVREYDVAARFGGEEFAILLPGATADEAAATAERIRQRMAARRFDVATALEPVRVTLSLGVACYPQHGVDLDALLHRADLAVYRAKVGGRDRVCLADADEGLEAAPAAHTPASGQTSPLSRLLGRAIELPDATPGELSGDHGPERADDLRIELRADRPALVLDDDTQDVPPDPLPGSPGEPIGVAGPVADVVPRTSGRRATWPVTSVVVLLASALAAACAAHYAVAVTTPETLLLFPLLAVLAELVGEDVYGSSAVTVSGVAVLGAVAADQPLAALAAAAASALVGAIAVRRTVEQAVFNMANLTLCAGVAYAVRHALGGAAVPSRLPELAGAMILAGVAYFLLDNGLVSLAVSRDEGRPWWRVFRDDLAWLLPHFAAYGVLGAFVGVSWQAYGLTGILVALLPLALVRVAQRQYLRRTRGQVAQLRTLAADLEASRDQIATTNRRLAAALERLQDQHVATARTLARAIDARDHTTGGHIERVCALGVELCESVDPAMAADPQVAFAFLLHDVGKIGVPDHVLLKPGPLTEAERAVMARHPAIGAALLAEAGFSGVARDVALTHHERWDGSGYPQGLRGEQIPVASRLFAVVDALDAMINDRPYRRGLPLAEAFEELRRGSGRQFDPAAVTALLALDEQVVRRCLNVGVTAADDRRRVDA